MNVKVLKKIIQISLLKTIIFNMYYLGIKGILRLPIIVSRNIHIHTLKGKVYIDDYKLGTIQLGFGDVGIFYRKYDKGMWQNTGNIFFKGKANIGHGSKISNSAHLQIGNNLIMTAKAEIICKEKIEIGENCLISWDTLIMDTDFHTIYDSKDNHLNPNRPVIIEDNVWIGCRSLILKGSCIPNESVVAANSTITNDFSEKNNIMIGGVNKILKENVKWKM